MLRTEDIMKRILGLSIVAVCAASTIIAGLVADDGGGIVAPPATPVIEEPKAPAPAMAESVEEKGAPTKDAPAPLAKPDATKPVPAEDPEPTAATKCNAVKEKEPAVDTTAAPQKPAEASTATVDKAQQPCQRGDRAFFVAVGRSRADVEAIALGLEFFSSQIWFDDGNWYCNPFLELLVGYWEGDAGHTGVTSLHEAGASAYIRCIRKQQASSCCIRPYADVGLGLHYITEDRIEGKELGRQWLAGSNVGVGLVLGNSERFDIGLRIRHLSNGGTRDINWGINHYMMRAAIRF